MTRWLTSADLKYRSFSTRQCTGHHYTDKKQHKKSPLALISSQNALLD